MPSGSEGSILTANKIRSTNVIFLFLANAAEPNQARGTSVSTVMMTWVAASCLKEISTDKGCQHALMTSRFFDDLPVSPGNHTGALLHVPRPDFNSHRHTLSMHRLLSIHAWQIVEGCAIFRSNTFSGKAV